MRPLTATLTAAIVVLFCFGLAVARDDGDKPSSPQPEPIELSGTIHRPVKWTPQLKVWPAGQFQTIDLQGKLLDGLAEGTPIWVKGVVRSQLHTGADSPFPAQWILWMEVTDLKVLDERRDIFEKHGD
jgi:hypothetical protein